MREVASVLALVAALLVPTSTIAAAPGLVRADGQGPHDALDAALGLACSRLDDLTLRCWGTFQFSWNHPPRIHGAVGSFAASYYNVCALRANGTLACHDGGRALPAPGTQVSAGAARMCVRLVDGTVACGDAAVRGRPPERVANLTDVVRVSTGGIGWCGWSDVGATCFPETACALRVDATVACWGYNLDGELGDGTTFGRAHAAAVVGLTDAVDVSVGSRHACAVRANGELLCWGSNSQGQLGDGTRTSRLVPTPVVLRVPAARVSAGADHTCALDRNGGVWCWGGNDHGQLGNVGAMRELPGPALTHSMAEVAAGPAFTCARDVAGLVHCWGSNTGGQLGTSPQCVAVYPWIAPSIGACANDRSMIPRPNPVRW